MLIEKVALYGAALQQQSVTYRVVTFQVVHLGQTHLHSTVVVAVANFLSRSKSKPTELLALSRCTALRVLVAASTATANEVMCTPMTIVLCIIGLSMRMFTSYPPTKTPSTTILTTAPSRRFSTVV